MNYFHAAPAAAVSSKLQFCSQKKIDKLALAKDSLSVSYHHHHPPTSTFALIAEQACQCEIEACCCLKIHEAYWGLNIVIYLVIQNSSRDREMDIQRLLGGSSFMRRYYHYC